MKDEKPHGNDAWRCAKCGACSAGCPVYQVTGNEVHCARGRLHLIQRLGREKVSKHFGEIFSQCLLCGGCRDICPRDVNITELILQTRRELPLTTIPKYFSKYLIRQTLASPFLLKHLTDIAGSLTDTVFARLPPESGLRLRLAVFDSSAIHRLQSPASHETAGRANEADSEEIAAGPGRKIYYFTGCMARYITTDVSAATRFLLRKTGHSPMSVDQETCCGLAAYSAGDSSQAKTLAQKNISAFGHGDESILTSCASCFSHLKSYPELFADDPHWQSRAQKFADRIREFSTYFSQEALTPCYPLPQQSTNSSKVLYHDPCHLRFQHHITSAPRQLINAAPALQTIELAGAPRCCGFGGLFSLSHPELSKKIFKQLQSTYSTQSPDLVTSTCSGCLIQWQQQLTADKDQTRVIHLAVLLAEQINAGKEAVRE